MAKPTISLHTDIRQPLKVLSDAERGRLFDAILDYGENGTIPEFEGLLALAWGFIKPKIDQEQEEQNQSVLKRQYATACRERKRKGETAISFDEWLCIAAINGHQ